MNLYGSGAYNAGGHTQTQEYTNRSRSWLVSTKPKDSWESQIARVQFSSSSRVSHYYNTEMPRLSYLNHASQEFGISYQDQLIVLSMQIKYLDCQ